jgi:hypothetical protein
MVLDVALWSFHWGFGHGARRTATTSRVNHTTNHENQQEKRIRYVYYASKATGECGGRGEFVQRARGYFYIRSVHVSQALLTNGNRHPYNSFAYESFEWFRADAV